MGVLTKLFEKKFGKVKTIGIGDSRNDISMLEAADVPALVKNKRGEWLDISISGVYKANGQGPFGWVKVVERYITDEAE